MPKTVAVIGAGPAGLAAVKCSLDEGLLPVCYEKAEDIGGIWNYTDISRDGYPSIYASLTMNTSKEMTCYSDFPFPKEFSAFTNHYYYKKYLQMYVSNFKLAEYIRYQHEVLRVEQVTYKNSVPKWRISIKNGVTGEISTEIVDTVMVCSGHLHEPIIPKFAGIETFKGRVMHTRDYKDFRGFERKRVLVVGIGSSAADVASELSRHAEHVYVSTRSGTYVLQRAGEYGVPFDQAVLQRWTDCIPVSLLRPFYYHKLNSRYKHSNYGLSPNFRFEDSGVTISDDLPNRILVGAITVKPSVERFTESSAIFEDGTRIDGIDAIIFATGFQYSMPFLDDSVVKIDRSFPHLYKLVFPPHIQPPTLAVIGLINAFGPDPPVAEMQARWACRVFTDACILPGKEIMTEEIEAKKRKLSEMALTSLRYTLYIPFVQYMDEIADMIGCKPRLWKYFFTNPRLWYRLFLGPATPPQWRVDGPGAWSGAQRAIEKVEENTYYHMRSRKAGIGEKEGLYDGWINLFQTLAILLIVYFSLQFLYRKCFPEVLAN